MPRSDFVAALARHPSPLEAGLGVWKTSEPWVRATFELAREPGVRLAEVPDWAALLDRHSVVDLEVRAGDTEVCWSNVGAAEPEPAECEFRRGVLTALASGPGDGHVPRVDHVRCRARGDETCVFAVRGRVPEPDPLHASALYEAYLLECGLQGRESFFRRIRQLEAASEPVPDVRQLRTLRRFLEEIEDIMLVFDANLTVIDANQAAQRFAGMSLDAMRGLSARDLLSADSFAIVRGSLPMLFEAGSARGLVVEGRARSGWVPLEISARVDSSRAVIICMARDISQHLALERELGERNRQLREQNQRMREADLLKSEFLANVSHELHTPLTSIRGFAKLLERDVQAVSEDSPLRLTPEKRLEFLQIVGSEAQRMRELIDGLLELSTLQSGVVVLDRTPASLNDIARESLLIVKPRLEERQLGVDLALDPSLPEAQLDPERMKQVVLNLLDNAVKFSPPGATLSVRTASVGGMVQLAVANPADEMPDAQLERIFERFVQRDGSFNRSEGGVGLGLNLVRAIAELHGGKAWAEYVEAGRIEFSVRVPQR
ncbi:MAG: PAS domain S-box protein [Deltaproteobacteria bacterium]|nr:PAS domain S-box protein [Deltaproteobacteria bacterium]